MPGSIQGGVGAYVVAGAGAAANTQNTTIRTTNNDPSDDSFKNAMLDAQSKTAQTSVNVKTNTNSANTLKTDTDTKTVTDKDQTTDNKVDNEKQSDSTDKTKENTAKTDDKKGIKDTDAKDDDKIEDVIKDAEDAGKELVSKISETFDIDEEDIIEAMETLGLSMTDILNPENLTNLVTQVTGQEDVTAILTDADLYDGLQDIIDTANKLVADISNENGITKEETIDILSTNADEDINKDFEIPDINAEAVIENKEIKVEISVDDKNESFSKESDERNLEDEEVSADKRIRNRAENLQQTEKTTDTNNTYSQVVNNISNALDEVTNTTTSQVTSYTRVDNTEILRQITDYIKVNVTEDMKSMELSLHPASLGNVKVIVEQAQDGGMVAKFTAQTDAVKNALSSQLLQLQQRLDEQGVKVNAVEVTVDTHAFEQNLEQNSSNQGNANEESARASRVRRINLADPDLSLEDIEELDDSTRIAAQMMAANGNSVDYTA